MEAIFNFSQQVLFSSANMSHLGLLEIIILIVTLDLWELLKIALNSATYELKSEILGKPVTLVQLKPGDEFW